MPWKGVTVGEQRQPFLEDYQLNYYYITGLTERFCISRKTAYKWINRIKQYGQIVFRELSRIPHRVNQPLFHHLSPCVEVEWKRNYPIREYTHR